MLIRLSVARLGLSQKCKLNHSGTLSSKDVVDDEDPEDVVDVGSGDKVGGTAVVGAIPEEVAGVVDDDDPGDVLDPGSGGKDGGKAVVGADPEDDAGVVDDDDLQDAAEAVLVANDP